ncbi:MAG: hypothetical protein ACK5MA_00080 [Parachlamydiaceae bacterium]
MKILWLITSLLLTAASFADEECSTCASRFDVGPAFASIDMLESGHTKRTLNLWGVRADATILIWKGLCIKPTFLSVDGNANLNSGSIALGFCFPIVDKVSVTPSYGYTETRFKSRINFREFNLLNLREKFHSKGQFVAVDGCWTFIPGARVYAGFQWAWSRVHTTVRPLYKVTQHCQGPSYSGCLEYDLTPCLSINIAGAYNLSLSKEKHGLRGKGGKLGLVYWY